MCKLGGEKGGNPSAVTLNFIHCILIVACTYVVCVLYFIAQIASGVLSFVFGMCISLLVKVSVMALK